MLKVQKAVILCLALLAGVAVRPAAAQQPDGQAIFRDECKTCHGINGVPPALQRTKYAKLRSLGDSGFVSRLSQDSVVMILKHGIDQSMKSFAEKLSDQEIQAVATYIRELAHRRAGT
jgi:mono/diheme cytochrome c family protein